MTNKDKTDIDLDVINLFKYIAQGDEKNSILYIRGDAEFKNAVMMIKGDATLLANTMIHHIENDPQFKQYILAVIGAWLSKNPEEAKMFTNGLELMRKQNEMYIVKEDEL